MKNRVSYFVALMAVLTGAATTGHAFTLGEMRGNAVIGRLLDVSVPVMSGVGEDPLASCLSAEVLFAEAQQIGPSVTVTPVSSGAVPVAMVRIRSASAVDEPVVTVVLRSTCSGAFTRRYVLLSDFPAPDLPKLDAPVVAAPMAPVASSPSTALPQAATGIDAAVSAPNAPAVSALPSVAKAVPPARAVAPKPAVAPVKKRPKPTPPPIKPVATPAPEPVQAKPVLKLDQSVVLPMQGEAPGPVAQPAFAAASAPTEDALQQAVRVEALQNDIKVLKDLALKNEASLAEFQSKLRQAEAERVPLTWFYLLSGLLAATLATLTWVLRKQQAAKKGDDAWWQQVKDDPSETVTNPPSTLLSPAASTEVVSDNPRVAPVASVAPVAVVAPLTPETQSDADVNLDIDLDGLAPADVPPSETRPLAFLPPDGAAIVHSLNVDEVSDVRQQAEFFVSLGQIDRALDVLHKQILQSPQPNPLVYLDLLTLYHSQGMKSDFRELRAAFGRYFNGVVPDYSAFNLVGHELLDYPEPLAVLVRFWPNIEAIAFLEACIFRNDAAPMQMSFDLAAFRDLLMLHAVAEKVTSDSPWKMTRAGGLSDQGTGPAELAGLAMVMDMRGKPAS